MVKIEDNERRKVRHELEDALRPSAKFVRFIADCAGLPDNRQCSETVISELESVFAEKERMWSEERDAAEAVRKALSDIVDGEVLYIRRRKNVAYVCKHDNIYRWVARIKILKRKKLIGLPNDLYKGCEWHEYKTTDDIIILKDRLRGRHLTLSMLTEASHISLTFSTATRTSILSPLPLTSTFHTLLIGRGILGQR